MRLLVAGLAKADLEIEAHETVRDVKARLEAIASMACEEMKLVIKGKVPPDDATVSSLGLGDSAKAMLMRSKLGAASAANSRPVASGSSATAPPWLAVGCRVTYVNAHGEGEPATVKAVHTDDPTACYYTVALEAGERQTSLDRLRPAEDPPRATIAHQPPLEVGEGPVALTVSQGRTLITVRCEASSSVRELKALLGGPVGADPSTMKLLSKGKEAADASTVESLGLGAGGRLMLLFRARHHREVEGAAAVHDCAKQLVVLRERAERTRHRITKRLLAGAEAIAELGQVDGEVAALTQDLRNAKPAEAADAAQLRTAQLAELEEMAEMLREARRIAAEAELMAQLGR